MGTTKILPKAKYGGFEAISKKGAKQWFWNITQLLRKHFDKQFFEYVFIRNSNKSTNISINFFTQNGVEIQLSIFNNIPNSCMSFRDEELYIEARFADWQFKTKTLKRLFPNTAEGGKHSELIHLEITS